MPVHGVDLSACAGAGWAGDLGGARGTGNGLSVGVPPGDRPQLGEGPAAAGSPHTALVLAGGGNRGACQVGMLHALVERGISAHLVVGTSVGAINAAGYAGAPNMEGVEHATRVWKRLSVDDIFPRGRLHGVWRFVEKRRSVFAATGLEQLVRGFLRFERLEDAMVPLVVVTTRVADGAEVWMTEGPAAEAVLASAALPGLYPPVELGAHRYVDGGVLNNAPLSVALAAGAKRVYLLLCGTIRSAPRDPQRPFEALLSAFNTSLHARIRRDLAAVPDDVDVIVVEAAGLSHIGWEDFTRTEELIEHGYNAACAVFDRYAEAAAGEPVERGAVPEGATRGIRLTRSLALEHTGGRCTP